MYLEPRSELQQIVKSRSSDKNKEELSNSSFCLCMGDDLRNSALSPFPGPDIYPAPLRTNFRLPRGNKLRSRDFYAPRKSSEKEEKKKKANQIIAAFLTPKIYSKHRVFFDFPSSFSIEGATYEIYSKETRCFVLILGVRNAPNEIG